MPRAKKSDDAAALAVVSRAAKRAAAVQTDCAEESDLLDGIEPQSRRQACEQARARLIEAQLKVKVGYGIDRDPSCLFEPVGDRLIVRRDSREMISPGGIVMPENSTAPPNSGVVLSVGPGAWIGGTAEEVAAAWANTVLSVGNRTSGQVANCSAAARNSVNSRMRSR